VATAIIMVAGGRLDDDVALAFGGGGRQKKMTPIQSAPKPSVEVVFIPT